MKEGQHGGLIAVGWLEGFLRVFGTEPAPHFVCFTMSVPPDSWRPPFVILETSMVGKEGAVFFFQDFTALGTHLRFLSPYHFHPYYLPLSSSSSSLGHLRRLVVC